MGNNFKNFYRHFYQRTGGYIPAKPLNQNIYPGDFFQVVNGETVVLGNIFRNGVIQPEECRFESGIKLNSSAWTFTDGVTKPYSGRGTGIDPLEGQFEFSKQVLAFSVAGSFFFKGNDPESVKIANWNEIQQQLIIKLTQTYYSFREVYVVTESATTSDWTLAVSSSDRGELEIATDAEDFGLVDIFGHQSARTIQSNDMEYYHREDSRKPCFFKAMKLVVQDERKDIFVNELLSSKQGQDEWASQFYNYDFQQAEGYTPDNDPVMHGNLLDMLPANQLNPNTALLYFKWADVSMDDVEKFFVSYGSR